MEEEEEVLEQLNSLELDKGEYAGMDVLLRLAKQLATKRKDLSISYHRNFDWLRIIMVTPKSPKKSASAFFAADKSKWFLLAKEPEYLDEKLEGENLITMVHYEGYWRTLIKDDFLFFYPERRKRLPVGEKFICTREYNQSYGLDFECVYFFQYTDDSLENIYYLGQMDRKTWKLSCDPKSIEFGLSPTSRKEIDPTFKGSLVKKLLYEGWSSWTPSFIDSLGVYKDWVLENLSRIFVPPVVNKSDTTELIIFDRKIDLVEINYKEEEKLLLTDSIIQPNDERYHEHKYCLEFIPFKFEQCLDKMPIKIERYYPEEKERTYCQCGRQMILTRLKCNYAVPSYCYCGKRNGIYKVDAGKLLYLCSSCHNSHECYQEDMTIGDGKTIPYRKVTIGQPLGTPCCATTKIFRLHVHHLMNEIWAIKEKNGKWRNTGQTRSKMYYHLRTMMNMTEEKCHIAKFSVEDCVCVLKKLTVWNFFVDLIPTEIKHLIVGYVT